MTRPVNAPTFATAATFPAGSNAWSSQPPRVAPSSGMLTQGFTPQADLPAEYLNYLFGTNNDLIGSLDALLTDHEFHFADDFAGAAVSSVNWTMANSPAIADDSPNGACGAVHLASTTAQSLVAGPINVGTKDFIVAIRARANVTFTSQIFVLGFANTGSTKGVTITSSAGANWTVAYHDLTATYVSALAASDHAYHNWRIMRLGGVMYIYLDGALLTTFSDGGYDYSSGQQLSIKTGTGTSPDSYVDYIKLWLGR